MHLLGIAYIAIAISFDLQFSKGITANVLLGLVLVTLFFFHSSQSHSVRMKGLPDPWRPSMLSHDWAFLLYVAIILFSAFWSVAPLESIKQGIPLIVPWLSSLLLCRLKVDWVVGVVAKFGIAASLLSLLMIRVDRDLAFQPLATSGQPELRGIFDHQLYLGAFLALTIGLVLISWLNGDIREVFGRFSPALALILGLLVLVAMLGRARLFTAAAGLAFILTWILSKRALSKLTAFVFLPALALLTVTNFTKIAAYLSDSGIDVTLTSRTLIWDRALAAVEDVNNTIGYGFGTFQLPRFDYMWGMFSSWRPWHAHNCFVNIYFELGIIGLIAVALLIFLQLRSAWRYSVRCGKFSHSMFLVLFCALGGLLNGREYDGFLSPAFCLMLLVLAIESRTKGLSPESARVVANSAVPERSAIGVRRFAAPRQEHRAGWVDRRPGASFGI